LELKEAINNCSLINDSYNSDLGSLNIALDFLEQQKQHPRKVVILSDILQSGKGEAELYQTVAGLLRQKNIHRFIGIGKSISNEKNSFRQIKNLECLFFSGTEEFIHSFNPKDFQHETILLKGARIFEFERISKLLEQKVHQTILEINLTAIAHNLKQYQELLHPSTKIMAIVKAFSYGSGSFEIASLLQFHGVEYLAVAYADEGIDLRRAGISLPIMVMNPEPSTYEALMQWNLEPEIYSLLLLKQFETEVRKNNLEHFSIHLKMDTGMHRLGFDQGDLQEVGNILKNNPFLRVVSIFSHLAASEDAAQDAFTRHQEKLFLSMSDEVMKYLGYPVLRHIANSSAIHRHPALQMDMVRLGIGMYGIDSTPSFQEKLKNVSTLKTTVAQLKDIPAGETIGYGRSGIAADPIRIATVRIGYADGYPRRLGNGKGKMLIRGKLAPIIGNICMDMLMIDVTAIAGMVEGEEVIVFGDGLSVQTISKWAETIPYEILTGISQRVKRVYYQE
ncbi:MAG: alanine racemase, partial [Chitinophagaceae bacterium]